MLNPFDDFLTQKVILLMTGVPGTVEMRDQISQLIKDGDQGNATVVVEDLMTKSTAPSKNADNLALAVQYLLDRGFSINLTTQKIDQLIADSFREGIDDSWLGLITLIIDGVGNNNVGKILENRANAAEDFTNRVNERSGKVDVNDPLVQDWIDEIDASNASLNAAKNSLGDLIDQLTKPPVLTSSTPLDEAIEVAINQDLMLVFNKAVKAGTGNIVMTGTDGDIRIISVTDTSQVTINGRLVTINPTEDLHPNTTYSVELPKGVFMDSGDRLFAGNSDLNFNTIDTLPPELTGTAPLDDAIEVTVDKNISLTFSEKIQAGVGDIILTSDDGTDIRTIAITDGSQVTFAGDTLIINPISDLLNGKGYSVQLAEGVITDLAGNSYAGITDAMTLNFRTVSSAIITPPPVIPPPVIATDDTQINTYWVSEQTQSSITGLSDGGFVVTWTSFGQDGSDEGIYGQRYDVSGIEVGGEFQINSYTTLMQDWSSVAGLSDGGFVVTWTSADSDGGADRIHGQRYDASGTKVGDEFQISTYRGDDQWLPSVTGLNDGGFVVTWISGDWEGADDIYGQRYDASGTKVGDEFRINTYTGDDQWLPSVTGLNDGGFVVTWTSFGQDGSDEGIYGQRYDTNGLSAGVEFQINTYTPFHQADSSVVGLSDGGFIVTWESFDQDGDLFGIYGQRYDVGGVPVGSEFQINTYTIDTQESPSVTGLSDGGFVVTWSSVGQDGDNGGIYGQRYNASGAPVGSEFQINTYTSDRQGNSSVVGLSDGGFIVTWSSLGQDGDGLGIYGKRYDASGTEIAWIIPGATLFLTTDPDTILGTVSDDLIIGEVDPDSGLDTLQTVDFINGGTGFDTMRLELSGLSIPAPTVNNVESMVISTNSLTGAALDMTEVTGLQSIYLAEGLGSISFLNINNPVDLSIDDDSHVYLHYSATALVAEDEMMINLNDEGGVDGGSEGTLIRISSDGTDNGIETLHIVSARSGVTDDITLAGSALTSTSTLILSGVPGSSLNLNSSSDFSILRTIDAGASLVNNNLFLANLITDLNVTGGAGNDTILSGVGNDNVSGNAGNDSLTGNTGNDRLEGGDGADELFGDGRDAPGDNGQDTLIGGPGKDFIVGSYFDGKLNDDFLSDSFKYSVGDSLNLSWTGWSATTADQVYLGKYDILDLPFDIVSTSPSDEADFTILPWKTHDDKPLIPSTGITADSMSHDIAIAISKVSPAAFSQTGDTILVTLYGDSAVGTGYHQILVQNSNDNNTYDAAVDTVIATSTGDYDFYLTNFGDMPRGNLILDVVIG